MHFGSTRTLSGPAITAALLWLLAPAAAQACATCFTQDGGDTRIAFIATTAFMTGLPFLLLGSIGWWLRRRYHRLQSEARSDVPIRAEGATRRPVA